MGTVLLCSFDIMAMVESDSNKRANDKQHWVANEPLLLSTDTVEYKPNK